MVRLKSSKSKNFINQSHLSISSIIEKKNITYLYPLDLVFLLVPFSKRKEYYLLNIHVPAKIKYACQCIYTCTLMHASMAKSHTLKAFMLKASFKNLLVFLLNKRVCSSDVVQVVHIRVLFLFGNLTTLCDICWLTCSYAEA